MDPTETSSAKQTTNAEEIGSEETHDPETPKGSASCVLCNSRFPSFTTQRLHTRTDWHGYNLKQRMNGLRTVSEVEFEKLIDELDMSISGSEDESSEDDSDVTKNGILSTLLRKQAKIREGEDHDVAASDERRSNLKGSPIVHFSSLLLPSNTYLGIYKALFTEVDLEPTGLVSALRTKQLQPFRPVKNESLPASKLSGPKVFLCMIGGGHFAGMIVSLTPKIVKNAVGQDERQAIVLTHKTFHRYTTRRKQGGSQSANDASKGNAHSAGAGIRRHNETALEAEVRALLVAWKELIAGCDLLFVRATGVTNRKVLFGTGPDQVLRSNDPRVRGFPFSTRRATHGELMRAFVELTRAKIEMIEDVAPREEQKRETPKQVKDTKQSEITKEEQEALLHTSQIQALIRRSKAPGLVSYINNNSLSPNFVFHPSDTSGHRHAPTPLHLAASTNSAVIIQALLIKAKADPTIVNPDGKTAFELAGDRATRDAFRIARSELGESAWNWSKAHVSSPLTKVEAEERDRTEKAEEQKAESARRQSELQRLEQERGQESQVNKSSTSKTLGSLPVTAEDRREIDGRGLTPEMRAKLERERRARAAEERIKKLSGKS